MKEFSYIISFHSFLPFILFKIAKTHILLKYTINKIKVKKKSFFKGLVSFSSTKKRQMKKKGGTHKDWKGEKRNPPQKKKKVFRNWDIFLKKKILF